MIPEHRVYTPDEKAKANAVNLAAVNACPLTGEQMAAITERANGLLTSDEWQEFDLRVDALVEVAAALGHADPIGVAMSYDYRMAALSGLRSSPEYGAYAVVEDPENKRDIVDEVLFAVAGAHEVLDWPPGGGRFDPASFFRAALMLVPVEGSRN